ncbi:MAG: transketolase family protein, partial [Chitinophagales bacterium]
NDNHWRLRDRFFLDAGHMSAMLYASLTLLGNYSLEELQNFRQWGSPTPGHPELDVDRGIENTSGPLGLGHAFGIGAAIAERFLAARFGEVIAHKTYIYISDGGVQEEISQGGGRIAGHLGLGNIIMFYDANDIQLSTTTDDVTSEDTAKKYAAWHWHVVTIDGNDHDALRQALKESIAETERPSLIIGKTVMGKGVRDASGQLFEGEVELHGKPLGKSSASFERTIEGLGGNPKQPFAIFPEVATHYTAVKAQKRALAAKKKSQFNDWVKANPKLAEKLDFFFSKKLPSMDWKELHLQQKPNQATRNASSTVLSNLAEKVENMIVASADLSNSDKTDGFLKKTTAFQKGDFSGAFLQAGVAELTMAALATGMALHGGVIPACATFFAFSDYMKPAIRVCALMEQQVIFIWTHDAFRVGEDGPTHQPIEQEAQIRLLEQLQNHSGKNSFLALRPADSNETTAAWRLALENTHTPTGLIFSRQDIQDLPLNKPFETSNTVAKGAYQVIKTDGQADVILVANGSEVATLVDAAEILKKENNLKAAVISAPSEGLFRTQLVDYQLEILHPETPTFGLTAGLPSTLRGLVGTKGEVWGLSHFGYSAPYTVLDEKFGFTPKQVAEKVLVFLRR